MDLLDNILDLFSSTRPADLEWKIMSRFKLSSVPNHHINSLCGIIAGMPQAIPGFSQLVYVLRDDKLHGAAGRYSERGPYFIAIC